MARWGSVSHLHKTPMSHSGQITASSSNGLKASYSIKSSIIPLTPDYVTLAELPEATLREDQDLRKIEET